MSIGGIAAPLADPGRVIGMHFFNPVPIMALLELVVSEATRPEVLDAAWAQVGARQIGGPEAVVGGDKVKAEGPFFIGQGVVFEGDAHVGPGTILGAGARVGAGARLEGVVVWDGAVIQPGAHIRRAVVYDGFGLELSELLTLGTR